MIFIYLSRVLRTRPLSCGFDSSVGRALHGYRKGRGFESRSKPEFFSGHFSSLLWLHSHLSFFHYLLLLDTYYQSIEGFVTAVISKNIFIGAVHVLERANLLEGESANWNQIMSNSWHSHVASSCHVRRVQRLDIYPTSSRTEGSLSELGGGGD